MTTKIKIQLIYNKLYTIIAYTSVYYLVPHPSLVITGVPLDGGFHAGLPLTFVARAEFPLAVDTPLSVSGVWSAPDDNSSRVSIVDPVVVQNRPTVYVSNYSLVLDMELDAGTYTFSLNISSAPFLTGTTISSSREVTVLGKDCRLVSLIESH